MAAKGPFWNYSLFPTSQQRRRGLIISLRNKLWKQFCCTFLPWTKKAWGPHWLLHIKRHNFIVEKKPCSSKIIAGILRQEVFTPSVFLWIWERKFHLFSTQRLPVPPCQRQTPLLPGDRHSLKILLGSLLTKQPKGQISWSEKSTYF